MKCPYCGNPDSKVIDSRSAENGQVIRRRRECKGCRRRFTTFERFEQFPVTVIKRNGDREPYKREKIRIGLGKAFEKRPVTSQQIEDLTSEIEAELREEGKKEINASAIGMAVLRKLKEIDEVAYLRFASVYKDFKDISEFQSELGQLLEKKEDG
ncbi:MAG: transcriptional regulator NrdR [Actinomycetota bacterium]|nr:transcriptional regulator NrdR [Actinomycetota bacterium]MDD5667318.1 transcriptional regulator NrdR [Actinomycetota bacterium]